MTVTGQGRPTATIRPRDLSEVRDRASAAPAIPTPVKRVERCVCGGYLVQLAGESIYGRVKEHNDTTTHQAWRARQSA